MYVTMMDLEHEMFEHRNGRHVWVFARLLGNAPSIGRHTSQINFQLRLIWRFPKMGVPQKFMVYFMENHTKLDDLGVRNQHIAHHFDRFSLALAVRSSRHEPLRGIPKQALEEQKRLLFVLCRSLGVC